MKKKYILGVDFLRVLAILAVIAIHTSTRTLEASQYKITEIPFTFFLNQIAVFAVPMFFLISGFALGLNHQQLNYSVYFKKRASRIIIPYLFWSLFYYFVYPLAHDQTASLVYLLITGNASYQLYFIPTMILFYLLFPLFKNMWKFFSRPFVIATLIIIQILFLIQDYYIAEFHMEPVLRVFLVSCSFFPIGIIASHHQEKLLSFVSRWISLFVSGILLCLVLIFGESFYLYQITKNIHYFYSQFHPLTLLYTYLIAGVAYVVFDQHDTMKTIIQTLSKLSFFVFFIHVSILYTFWYSFGEKLFLQTRGMMIEKIFYDIFFVFFVSGVSFLLAYGIHKLPYVSKITG